MPDQQSNAGYVSIYTVSFIDAFCRRNLSEREIRLIDDIIHLCYDSAPAQMRKEELFLLLKETPRVVTSQPSESSQVGPAKKKANPKTSRS